MISSIMNMNSDARKISQEAKKIVRQKLRKEALPKLSKNGNTLFLHIIHQTLWRK